MGKGTLSESLTNAMAGDRYETRMVHTGMGLQKVLHCFSAVCSLEQRVAVGRAFSLHVFVCRESWTSCFLTIKCHILDSYAMGVWYSSFWSEGSINPQNCWSRSLSTGSSNDRAEGPLITAQELRMTKHSTLPFKVPAPSFEVPCSLSLGTKSRTQMFKFIL